MTDHEALLHCSATSVAPPKQLSRSRIFELELVFWFTDFHIDV
jgi:hypothetical protein